MKKIKVKYVGDLSGIIVNSYKIKRGQEFKVYESDWEKLKIAGGFKLVKEKKEKKKSKKRR